MASPRWEGSNVVTFPQSGTLELWRSYFSLGFAFVDILTKEKALRQFLLLDLLRGSAALLVFLGHLRSSLFVSFGELPTHSILTNGWYFVTGLAHQAVVVFFVLSGFFIGRSVLISFANGRWRWSWYLTQRATRLEIVLVPAILTTWAFDAVALASAPHASQVYAATAPAKIAGAQFAGQCGWWDAIGNLLFLQTIFVPPFGSNGALWSLANEWWYYIMFPILIGIGFAKGGLGRRLLGAALLIAMLFLVGPAIAKLSGLWLLGVLAFLIHDRILSSTAAALKSSLALLSALGLVASLALVSSGQVPRGIGADYLVGAATALFVAFAAGCRPKVAGFIPSMVHGLADRSYTLYAVHTPWILFLAAWWWGVDRLQPGPQGFSIYLAVVALTLVYVEILYRCFEANTPVIRTWLWNLVQNGSSKAVLEQRV